MYAVLRRPTTWGLALAFALSCLGSLGAQGMPGHMHHAERQPAAKPKGSIQITMEELHKQGGVPKGWKFRFPDGDAKAGREVFAKLECYQCHEVKGEQFAGPSNQAGKVGPELTGMGSMHPAEYLAESILNPNAVIIKGPGYIGSDGRSIMPDYRESITAAELIDLVAYLKSLTGEHTHAPSAKSTGGGQQHKGH